MQRQEFSIEDIQAGRTMTLSDIGSMDAHVFECNKVRSNACAPIVPLSYAAFPLVPSRPRTFRRRVKII